MSDDSNEWYWDAIAIPMRLFNIWFKPFTVVMLWRWFVMPLGAPPLRWSQAFGLLMLAMLVRYEWKVTDKKKLTKQQAFESSFTSLGMTTIAFCLGFLAMKVFA